jgi:hypothetical protein
MLSFHIKSIPPDLLIASIKTHLIQCLGHKKLIKAEEQLVTFVSTRRQKEIP